MTAMSHRGRLVTDEDGNVSSIINTPPLRWLVSYIVTHCQTIRDNGCHIHMQWDGQVSNVISVIHVITYYMLCVLCVFAIHSNKTIIQMSFTNALFCRTDKGLISTHWNLFNILICNWLLYIFTSAMKWLLYWSLWYCNQNSLEWLCQYHGCLCIVRTSATMGLWW